MPEIQFTKEQLEKRRDDIKIQLNRVNKDQQIELDRNPEEQAIQLEQTQVSVTMEENLRMELAMIEDVLLTFKDEK